MATEIVKSGVLTNRDANPPVPSDLRGAGRNFQKPALCTPTTGVLLNSQYGFFSLPSNAVIVSALLSCAALGAATAGDIGLWETPTVGGFSATTGWATQAGSIANAKQFLGAATSLVAAQTKTQLAYLNATFMTIAKADQKIWQLLGLTIDPNRDYDVVLTNTTTITAGGAVLLEIEYKLV